MPCIFFIKRRIIICPYILHKYIFLFAAGVYFIKAVAEGNVVAVKKVVKN